MNEQYKNHLLRAIPIELKEIRGWKADLIILGDKGNRHSGAFRSLQFFLRKKR